MSDDVPISAVATTLAIIETMVDYGDPIGVSQLAKRLGANKPKTYRHLRTLVNLQYVAQDPETEKYYLTLRLFHLGQAIADRAEFLVEARRVLPKLREQTGQTVAVGQVEDQGVRILDILKHRATIEITTPPGTLFDFHSSAQGKVALAFGERTWDRLSLRGTPRHPGDLGVDVKALESDVAQVRRRGWAVAPEESLIGVNALAAPVFDASGQLAGTIAVVGSIQHLPATPDNALITAVQQAAAAVSERLGYQSVAA